MLKTLDQRILDTGIIAICRKIYGEPLLLLAQALYQGGIRQMEVTFDQADPECIHHTAEAISALREQIPDMDLGTGTVLTLEQVEAAYQAGSSFIVSPNTDPTVIARTKELGMISIPGAMTPSEIITAHDAGADIVKLFPASWLGAGYVKEITAPISHIKLLATGGINLENFGNFLQAGCCGAGIGGTMCDKVLIRERRWDELTARAKQFCGIFQQTCRERG